MNKNKPSNTYEDPNESTNPQAHLYQDLTNNLAEQAIEPLSQEGDEYTPNEDYVDPSDSKPRKKHSVLKAILIAISGPFIIIGSLILFSITDVMLRNQPTLRSTINYGLSLFGFLGVLMIILGPIMAIILLNRSK